MGPRTENLLRTRFVSHNAKILCLYKQNIEGKCGQTKLYPIYIMVMHKETIQLVFYTQVKAHSKAGEEKW
jgi:hypothetical protein